MYIYIYTYIYIYIYLKKIKGFLYKKTNSTINKDWKKKFVTLHDDGTLKYYPSMNVSIKLDYNIRISQFKKTKNKYGEILCVVQRNTWRTRTAKRSTFRRPR